jgi:hypothetical protein
VKHKLPYAHFAPLIGLASNISMRVFSVGDGKRLIGRNASIFRSFCSEFRLSTRKETTPGAEGNGTQSPVATIEGYGNSFSLCSLTTANSWTFSETGSALVHRHRMCSIVAADQAIPPYFEGVRVYVV